MLATTVSIFAIIISFISAWFSWASSNEAKVQNETNFKNTLRDKITLARDKIVESKIEENSINTIYKVDAIREILMYMSYGKEKKRYLTDEQVSELNNLYEEIENCLVCILSNTDMETNKEKALQALEGFRITLS